MSCIWSPRGYDPSIPPPSNRFKTLGGVEVRTYDFGARPNLICASDSYRRASGRGWPIDPTFETRLDEWAQNFSHFAATYGKETTGALLWIGSHGTERFGRAGTSYHYGSQAIDISWVEFEKASTEFCASNPDGGRSGSGINTQIEVRRYLAVEASLRKYFGWVLNFRVPNHQDHLHVDDAGGNCPGGFHADFFGFSRRSMSVTYFIQNCIQAFSDRAIDNDGVYGDQTDREWKNLLALMNLGHLEPKTNLADYRLFLDLIVAHGLANKPAGSFKPESADERTARLIDAGVNVGSRLDPGESLRPGEYLSSPDGRYVAFNRPDDSLFIVFDREAGVGAWSTGVFGDPGGRVVMRTDGQLIEFRNGEEIWHSDTLSPGAAALMQNNGQLALYGVDVGAIWSNGKKLK